MFASSQVLGCALLQACAKCDATETPLWRNGAAGKKTLCNACGVKYQRGKHKQKVAEAAAAAAAAALAAASGEGDTGSRLNRSISGMLQSAQHI
jgi:GATA zinc finger